MLDLILTQHPSLGIIRDVLEHLLIIHKTHLDFQTPMSPPASYGECRFGPLFNDQDGNRTVVLESKVQHKPNSAFQLSGNVVQLFFKRI